jgi:hypothetical protein
MAGFEVVVRPVVFPNIRPPQAKPVLPADDPTKGQCVISGGSGEIVTLNSSWNYNQSKSRQVETERRVDKARVYQEENDGTVNKDNFVDINVPNRMKMRGGNQPGRRQFAEVDPNYPTINEQARQGQPVISLQRYLTYYKPIVDAKNIEILNRNVIQTNPNAGSD